MRTGGLAIDSCYQTDMGEDTLTLLRLSRSIVQLQEVMYFRLCSFGHTTAYLQN